MIAQALEHPVDLALDRLRQSNAIAVIACTGAGAGLQNMLWKVPGISSFLAGARFPYAQEDTEAYIGQRWQGSFASADLALRMAMAAYVDACRIRELRVRKLERATIPQDLDEQAAHSAAIKEEAHRPVIGLGLAASVTSNREHRGEHRVHVAVMGAGGAQRVDVVLKKGLASPGMRDLDGRQADFIALDALLYSLGESQVLIPGSPAGPSSIPLNGGYVVDIQPVDETELRQHLFELPVFAGAGIGFGSRRTADKLVGRSLDINPITGNPPHAGHTERTAIVSAATGRNGLYLLPTAGKTGKPAVTVAEALNRVGMLKAANAEEGAEWPIYVSADESLFVEMARKFPGAGIIVGGDAALRMLEPRWYEGGEAGLNAVFGELRSLKTNFYLFGRKIDGKFKSSLNILIDDIPGQWWDMFHAMDGEWDVSSTEIRQRRGIR